MKIEFLIIDDNEVAPDNTRANYTSATKNALLEEIGDDGEVWKTAAKKLTNIEEYKFEIDVSEWEIELEKLPKEEWKINKFSIYPKDDSRESKECDLFNRFIKKIKNYISDDKLNKLIIIMDLNLKQKTEIRSADVGDNVKSGIWLAKQIIGNVESTDKIKFLFITRYAVDNVQNLLDEINKLGELCKKPGLCVNKQGYYYKYSGDSEQMRYEGNDIDDNNKKIIINDLYEKKTRYYDFIGKVLESVWGDKKRLNKTEME